MSTTGNIAGGHHARVIMICVDRANDATRITELAKSEFPHVPVLARAFDRRHTIDLIQAGAGMQVKETFESALMLRASALEHLGASQAEIAEIDARVRESNRKRLQLEIEGGLEAGRVLFNRHMRQSSQPGANDP